MQLDTFEVQQAQPHVSGCVGEAQLGYLGANTVAGVGDDEARGDGVPASNPWSL
ncbi:MAG TPA: hypothetical protein VIQ02_09700 [Jiangellaceae bacterium]